MKVKIFVVVVTVVAVLYLNCWLVVENSIHNVEMAYRNKVLELQSYYNYLCEKREHEFPNRGQLYNDIAKCLCVRVCVFRFLPSVTKLI